MQVIVTLYKPPAPINPLFIPPLYCMMASGAIQVEATTLSDSDDSDCEDAAAEERFSLCEFDLDVVDDALSNPTNSEFRDHFGFRIQVKTDDEY